MVGRPFSLSPIGMGAALALIALAAAPRAVRAQQQSTLPIYASTDLESPPKLASPAQAAKVIDDSFPYPLRQSGVGGMVQLQIVIDPRGRVEEESIEVVETPNPALAEAARRAAKRLAFKPGYYKGEPVRTRVVLPILYKTVR